MPSKRNLTRDEKLQNLMLNYSMLMMSAFEGAFAALAAGMSEALVAGTDAMADALSSGLGGGSGAPKPAKRNKPNVGPQVSGEVAKLFSGMRKQMESNVPLNDQSFREFIKNPAFDEGIRIVESHDFRLPRFTERLSDDDLASYAVLLRKEDPELGKMLRELGEWQKGAPQFQR